MPDPNRNLDPAEHSGPAPEDAELEALEAELSPVLGVPRDVAPAASTGFRASLKDAFVSGRFEGDEALEAELGTTLRAWETPPASADARAASLHGLLTGERKRAGESRPAGSGPGERHTAAGSRTPAEHDRARRAPAPARSTSTRLRLLVGASLLAAAAAVLLIVGGGGGASVDDGGATSVEDTLVAAGWSLDAESRTVFSNAQAFDGVRVDGAAIASIEQLETALVSGHLVENGAEKLRLRHGDQFVLELDAGAAIDLSPTRPAAAANGMVLFADRGSIRVATGPGFDTSRGLVVRTPHVRTEIVGTIFGVDVTPGYTCVCCFEGCVDTEPTITTNPKMDVTAGSTRILLADGRSMESEIVGGHRGGLADLGERIDRPRYWL